jgi:ribosomal protein S18 acetylase RimI-like enzyme
VGHAALVPEIGRVDAEYIIFVDQPYRNRGLGSSLTVFAVDYARQKGLESIWLRVESYNFRAIKVYRKAGFRFLDEGERERTMTLNL